MRFFSVQIFCPTVCLSNERRDHSCIVTCVCSSGNLDKQTARGSTALHYCCLTDNSECLKLLLRGKASVSISKNTNWTVNASQQPHVTPDRRTVDQSNPVPSRIKTSVGKQLLHSAILCPDLEKNEYLSDSVRSQSQ